MTKFETNNLYRNIVTSIPQTNNSYTNIFIYFKETISIK